MSALAQRRSKLCRERCHRRLAPRAARDPAVACGRDRWLLAESACRCATVQAWLSLAPSARVVCRRGLLEGLDAPAHRQAQGSWAGIGKAGSKIVGGVGRCDKSGWHGDGIVHAYRWIAPAVRTPAWARGVVIDVGRWRWVEGRGLTIASVPPRQHTGAAGAGERQCQGYLPNGAGHVGLGGDRPGTAWPRRC